MLPGLTTQFLPMRRQYPRTTRARFAVLGSIMLRRSLSSFFVLLCILWMHASGAFAQPKIEWQKCLGGTNSDYAGTIVQTSDGGSIVVCLTASTDGDVSNNHGSED